MGGRKGSKVDRLDKWRGQRKVWEDRGAAREVCGGVFEPKLSGVGDLAVAGEDFTQLSGKSREIRESRASLPSTPKRYQETETLGCKAPTNVL